jgi:hypothetical protein
MKFGPSIESSGLGDTLLLTAVCKYNPRKYTIQLPTNKKHFEILFEGLCQDVEITDNPKVLNEIGDGHYTTRKLRSIYGDYANLLDNRPVVLYSDRESEEWAENYIKNLNNPIIFVPNCSNRWHHIRSIPVDKSQEIISNLLLSNFNPIVCSSSFNPVPYFDNCKNLIDLDLKKYICLLRKVGKYIGCNTGDMHLSISVGALTKVFQPKSCAGFCEKEWNYNHPTISYNYI